MECNHCHKELSFFKQYYVSNGNRYCMECAQMFTEVAKRAMRKEIAATPEHITAGGLLQIIRKMRGVITAQEFHDLVLMLGTKVL